MREKESHLQLNKLSFNWSMIVRIRKKLNTTAMGTVSLSLSYFIESKKKVVFPVMVNLVT